MLTAHPRCASHHTSPAPRFSPTGSISIVGTAATAGSFPASPSFPATADRSLVNPTQVRRAVPISRLSSPVVAAAGAAFVWSHTVTVWPILPSLRPNWHPMPDMSAHVRQSLFGQAKFPIISMSCRDVPGPGRAWSSITRRPRLHIPRSHARNGNDVQRGEPCTGQT